MKTTISKLLGGTALALTLGVFSIGSASAVDLGVSSDTGVNTGVSTSQNTGVNVGTGSRINGGIRTGTNTSNTTVGTDVDTTTSADVRGGGRSSRDRNGDVSASSDTDVNTGVSTSQNSGVYVPAGTRVNGGIRTGSNISATDVNTNVDSDTRARLSTASSRGDEVSNDNRHRGWWQGNRKGHDDDRDRDGHND